MSFQQNFEGGAQPPQQGGEEQGGYGAAPGAPQQQPQLGQQMDPNQQQGQFPGAPPVGTPGSHGQQPGGDQKTTLWMGELEPWIDENFVRTVWFGMGYQVNVKMIRDKFSGYVRPALFTSDIRTHIALQQ